jgi:phosphoribosylformylglycinamidine cyclo-ligase
LHKYYAKKYPETFEPTLSDEVVYIGKNKLNDELQLTKKAGTKISIGKLLLSPTRTYAPLMKILLENYFDKINGVIHCSGGGQTKCMKYLPRPLKIIKDNLFTPPEIFQVIQQNSGADNKEMYQVFNMGHRLEIFTDETSADELISAAAGFNIDAKIIGHVEASDKKELQLRIDDSIITY